MLSRASLTAFMAMLYPEDTIAELLDCRFQKDFAISCVTATSNNSSHSSINIDGLASKDLTRNSPQEEVKPIPQASRRTIPTIPRRSSSRAMPTALIPSPIMPNSSPCLDSPSHTTLRPGSLLILARSNLIVEHCIWHTHPLVQRLTKTYELRQNALFFPVVQPGLRPSHAWRHPETRQEQRVRVGDRKNRQSYASAYLFLGEAGATHRRNLKHAHGELASVLRRLYRFRDLDMDRYTETEEGLAEKSKRSLTETSSEKVTESQLKIQKEKTETFLIRFKAVQRTRENVAKRTGVWGTSRRSVASMCVGCEIGLISGRGGGMLEAWGLGLRKKGRRVGERRKKVEMGNRTERAWTNGNSLFVRLFSWLLDSFRREQRNK